MEKFEKIPLSKREVIAVADAKILLTTETEFIYCADSKNASNSSYSSSYFCVNNRRRASNDRRDQLFTAAPDMDNSSLSSISLLAAIDNDTSIVDTSNKIFNWIDNQQDEWNFSIYNSSFIENFTENIFNTYTNSGLRANDSRTTCGQWEPAQHNFFQFSNMCFLSAFIVPRLYKSSILLFRFLLCVSFAVTSIWAGFYICAFDSFLWGTTLATINGIHASVLLYKFLPPALSLELTELYVRMFKPLKVSKKHFKELTKEACLLKLEAGETYAREDMTPADERLSILLRGRLNVTCNGTFMHNIPCFQFIDSPEWYGNATASGIRFQVTITAEEDSTYLCWSRSKIDRIFRHRPHVKIVLNSMIGKDITLKMYSLNEQVGHICTTEAMSRAAREDHWRRAINRSASVDAVNVGPKGHVRSNAWKQAEKQNRKGSVFSESESPLLGQQQCWVPVMASQFPAESPFIKQADTDSQNDETEPMLTNSTMQKPIQEQQLQLLTHNSTVEQTTMQQIPILNVSANRSIITSQPVALIPVIVPIFSASIGTNLTTPSNQGRPSLKQTRGVKFDETCL